MSQNLCSHVHWCRDRGSVAMNWVETLCVCIRECKILREREEEHAATQYPGLCFQLTVVCLCFCAGVTDEKQYSSLEGDSLSVHLPFSSGKIRSFALVLLVRMGCNLCTFQKREEHYKLLYEVSQVSAEDIASVSWLRLCALTKTLNKKGCFPPVEIISLVVPFYYFWVTVVFYYFATPPSDDFLWDPFNIFVHLLPTCQLYNSNSHWTISVML